MVYPAPNFEWQVEAVNRVERLLKTVTQALDQAKVPYAVIGGNAVAVWVAKRDAGATRATKDVDILLRRADLKEAIHTLEQVGFIFQEVMDIPVFMEEADPLPSQGVHVVLAGEKVKPSSKRPAPDVSAVERASSGFWVVELQSLLVMKLDAFRRVDQVHLEDMLRVGLIDRDMMAKLPEDLRARMIEIRDTMDWAGQTPPDLN